MALFERTEQPDVYVENSQIIPIVIKYADFNEKHHNENNTTSFKDAISQYNGIHSCIFINGGTTKSKLTIGLPTFNI